MISLTDTFSEYGTVDSVKIITDRDSGRSKGFGFIEMATDEQAVAAIDKLNGFELDGRQLTVNEARPTQPRENRGGFGDDHGNRW